MYYIDDLHKKYGPVVRISPSEVAIADLQSLKEIHKVGSDYVKSEFYLKFVGFPKPGLFSMTNKRQHGERRKLLSRTFSKTFITTHWETTVRDAARLCVSKIRMNAGNGAADVMFWWSLMASGVLSRLAFGHSFEMLEEGSVSSIRVFPRS